MELKNLKSLRKLVPLKKTITQLLIPLSIFSLVFSICSSTSFYYQNILYFSCNSFHSHLRTLALNKNCIFLICNGILVFLASLRPPPPPDADDTLQKSLRDALHSDTPKPDLLLSDKPIILDETTRSADQDNDENNEAEEEMEANGEEEREVDHHQEKEECNSEVVVYTGEREDDDQNELTPHHCWLFEDDDVDLDNRDDEDEEEDDEIEKMSTEELNQKFEDFIRRMKEEFRVNEYEKQQLVAVK